MEETTVDAQTRRLAGRVIVAIGVIVALVGALAGVIGLGDDDFGPLQIAAIIIGVIIAAIGVALTRWSPSAAEPTTAPSPSET
jgi:lipopolysaccharide export LptBFGC system permease protein LptF